MKNIIFIICVVLFICSCKSYTLKHCVWGDCEKGYGRSEGVYGNEALKRVGAVRYEGLHKDGKPFGYGHICSSNGRYIGKEYSYNGDTIMIKEKRGKIWQYYPDPDKRAEIEKYEFNFDMTKYKTPPELKKYLAISDIEFELFRSRNTTRMILDYEKKMPQELIGAWTIESVTYNKGYTYIKSDMKNLAQVKNTGMTITLDKVINDRVDKEFRLKRKLLFYTVEFSQRYEHDYQEVIYMRAAALAGPGFFVYDRIWFQIYKMAENKYYVVRNPGIFETAAYIVNILK